MDLEGYWITMLSEHKKRQALYLNIIQKPNDSDKEIIIKDSGQEELTQEVLNYFLEDTNQLIYPSKSYAVAIIYAHLLYKYFNVDIYESLKDKDLFQGTDKFFSPYNLQTSHIYDKVTHTLNKENLLDFEKSTVFQVRSSVVFFVKEFFIDSPDMSSIYLQINKD